MKSRRWNAGCLLFTALLFALYCTLPYFGAVSLITVFWRFLLYFVLSASGCLVLVRVSGRLLPGLHWERIERIIYERWTERKYVLLFWGILMALWLPAYLAFFYIAQYFAGGWGCGMDNVYCDWFHVGIPDWGVLCFP